MNQMHAIQLRNVISVHYLLLRGTIRNGKNHKRNEKQNRKSKLIFDCLIDQTSMRKKHDL